MLIDLLAEVLVESWRKEACGLRFGPAFALASTGLAEAASTSLDSIVPHSQLPPTQEPHPLYPTLLNTTGNMSDGDRETKPFKFVTGKFGAPNAPREEMT